jgi:hypothetical protein
MKPKHTRRGHPGLSSRFHIYLWLLLELARDRRTMTGRKSVLEVAQKFGDQLGFPERTIRDWHKKWDRVLSKDDGALAVLADRRQRREASDWSMDAPDLVSELDRSIRVRELFANELNSSPTKAGS